MKNDLSSEQPVSEVPTRWELIHDVAIFQVKLAIDALRDLLISPISIVAGLIDLVMGRKHFSGHFYNVLRTGRSSEEWINLFSQAGRWKPQSDGPDDMGIGGVDDHIDRLKRLIVEQYRDGTLSAAAKAAFDQSLNAIRRTGFRKNTGAKRQEPNE